ncbi:hypothetical protein ACJX0J_006277, partial [Zea mays]
YAHNGVAWTSLLDDSLWGWAVGHIWTSGDGDVFISIIEGEGIKQKRVWAIIAHACNEVAILKFYYLDLLLLMHYGLLYFSILFVLTSKKTLLMQIVPTSNDKIFRKIRDKEAESLINALNIVRDTAIPFQAVIIQFESINYVYVNKECQLCMMLSHI